jgi:5-methylcytosine-specific restriction endonuclease McrA
MVAFFNTPDKTDNNPFHVPWIQDLWPRYVAEWRMFWFANSSRRRVLQERLLVEAEKKRARSRRVQYLSRRSVYLFNDRRCHLCGRWVGEKSFQLDHEEPVSRGGRHTIDNVRLACASCNSSKSNWPLDINMRRRLNRRRKWNRTPKLWITMAMPTTPANRAPSTRSWMLRVNVAAIAHAAHVSHPVAAQ